MTDDIAVVETRVLPPVAAHEAMVARGEVTVEEVVAQRDKVEQVMKAVMKEGVHYGKVPGVSKPTLLKPGAEVLNVTFRFAPSYHSDPQYDGPHLTVISRCVLTHIPTGMTIAEGEGLCTTRESKYAFRQAGRVCPSCGMEAIIKGKKEYGGGWVCFKRKGGCGEKYADDDAAITSQTVGKVANPDLPDTWNTVLKMANKRALVAAILNGTAASDIFTQDVEDLGTTAADTHEVEDEPATNNDGRPAWNKPKDWQEISARLHFRLGPDEATDWIEQALLGIYGVERLREIEAEQLPTVAEQLCVVIRYLDDADTDPDGLAGSERAVITAAFAAGFDGLMLDGPPWRLGPEETDRPTKDEYRAQPQEPTLADAESPYGPPPDAPDDNMTEVFPENPDDEIPFGHEA